MATEVKRRRPGRPINPTSQDPGFMSRLGVLLRRARISRKLTMQQASKLTGGMILGESISKYETGSQSARVDSLLILASIYEYPLVKLLPKESRPAMRGKKLQPDQIEAIFGQHA